MKWTQKSQEKYNQDLKDKIVELKKQRKAVILAHNYQRPEIQDIADIKGDSLALSRAAAETDSNVIVVCGVRFMAESASILNPDKKVILPVIEAGCPLADMVNVDKINELKRRFPGAPVVCYVNSSAEAKAASDICCTSSNAVNVVKSLSARRVIFLPDKNLGLYVASEIPEKEIICWEGFCPSHVRLSREDLLQVKRLHPRAKILVHPECYPDVLKLADGVCSTKQMFDYVASSDCREFIIGTEKGIIYGLSKKYPDKKFYLASERLLCADMKLTTLGWVVHALEFMKYEVKVPKNIRIKAQKALDRMLEVR